MPNQWSLFRTVEPSVEPVTVEDMRLQSRISIGDDDAAIAAYIAAARHYAEIYQNRQIMTAEYRLRLDYFPSWTIKLPMPQLQSIESITYLDTQGVTQTLDPSLYLVDTDSAPGRVTPAYNKIWPVTRIQLQGVTITYLAGYTSAALVPKTTIHAIKLLAAHMYETRDPADGRRLTEAPFGVHDLLDCERVLDFSGVTGSSNNIPGAVSAWGGGNWWN